ncbi:MAG: hypothetical protein U0842_15170 [Candidatus Binatia bacterium]
MLDVPDNGALRVSPELRRAQEEAVRALRDRGMRVKTVTFKGLEKQFDVWSAMMSEAQEHPFSHMLGEARVRAGRELVKHALGRSAHTPPSALLALVDLLLDVRLFPGLSRRMTALGHELRASVTEALGLTACCSTRRTRWCAAPRHGVPLRWLMRMHQPVGVSRDRERPGAAGDAGSGRTRRGGVAARLPGGVGTRQRPRHDRRRDGARAHARGGPPPALSGLAGLGAPVGVIAASEGARVGRVARQAEEMSWLPWNAEWFRGDPIGKGHYAAAPSGSDAVRAAQRDPKRRDLRRRAANTRSSRAASALRPGSLAQAKGHRAGSSRRWSVRRAEVHRYEAHGVGRVNLKIKRFVD